MARGRFCFKDFFTNMCNNCPRKCNVNRDLGEKGFCGADNINIKVSRAALHFWEEPCISGVRGSGTIFFSYCPLKCVYCQNEKISRGTVGKNITIERLAQIMIELQNKGAHNINFVTPTHYVYQITKAIEKAKEDGLNIPIVYNTSGYELPEVIDYLEPYIDIYLTDFKYSNNEDALKYSKAPDYVEYAMESLKRMVKHCHAEFYYDKFNECEDEAGKIKMMKRGVIVRHLMLPGKLIQGKNILKRLFNEFGNEIYYSLMSQYTPLNIDSKYPELLGKVSDKEYEKLADYALRIGIENAFLQEGEAASESFIPDFDMSGV